MAGICDRVTFIYGLVDPRTDELRYVGKSVKGPKKRLIDHIAHAKIKGPKRHVVAWVASILAEGLKPEIFVLEEIAPGYDWIDAEQFWIAYFRSIGAQLCNLTHGGEGIVGHQLTAEQRAKRMLTAKRGSDHYRFGKPMPESVRIALANAMKRILSDPRMRAEWRRRRAASLPAGFGKRATERLMAFRADTCQCSAHAGAIEYSKSPS